MIQIFNVKATKFTDFKLRLESMISELSTFVVCDEDNLVKLLFMLLIPGSLFISNIFVKIKYIDYFSKNELVTGVWMDGG